MTQHFAQSRNSQMLLKLRQPIARRRAGASLIEAIIATGIVALFLSGAFAINSRGLLLSRALRNESATEQCSRDRLDKMRNAPWLNMVDATYIRDTVLGASGNPFPDLPGLVITVDVRAYRSPSGPIDANRVTVVRAANGTASIAAAGDGSMGGERTVMVMVTSSWPSLNQTRTHQAYTLVSYNGISGRNK